MNFEAFKREVFRLAGKKAYLLPGADTLFTLWEQKKTASEVVAAYCK